MNNERTIDVLNTLIEINNDRIEGYETASKETDEGDLRRLFAGLIQTSEECKEELTEEVERLGGTPTEGTRVTGKFFRTWMDVKAALTGKDHKALLNSCEYGEDKAIETYDKALKNDRDVLTMEQRTMIEAQRVVLQGDHDEIKDLRDQLVEH
jgi:uncharacterized protein (TIGR02284 family)